MTLTLLFQEKAESLGMVLKRTRSLNTSERFIEALASVVEEQIERGQGFKGSRDRVRGL